MSLQAKVAGLFFFQFSEGSYSDYRVGGTYVCGHEIADTEWDEHYREFANELAAKQKEMVTVAYNDPLHREQWKAWNTWRAAHASPEDTFIEKHNMVAIDVTECWRDN